MVLRTIPPDHKPFAALPVQQVTVGAADDTPLAQEIADWYRAELTKQLAPLIRAAGIKETALFAAPAPEGPTSVSYCPRCRCQFTGPRTHCPEGIQLLPVVKS